VRFRPGFDSLLLSPSCPLEIFLCPVPYDDDLQVKDTRSACSFGLARTRALGRLTFPLFPFSPLRRVICERVSPIERVWLSRRSRVCHSTTLHRQPTMAIAPFAQILRSPSPTLLLSLQ